MSTLEDNGPNAGLAADQPRSGDIRVPGNPASDLAIRTAARLRKFGITLDGTHVSLGSIPNAPILTARVRNLTKPLIACVDPEVLPTIPPFATLHPIRNDFAGRVARLLENTVDEIKSRMKDFADFIYGGDDARTYRDKSSFRRTVNDQIRSQWPNLRLHVYHYLAAHLEYVVAALVHLGLPCSSRVFTNIICGYIQDINTGRDHEVAFISEWNHRAGRLFTPLLPPVPLPGMAVQLRDPVELELRGAIEVVSSASNRRYFTDGDVLYLYDVLHHPEFDDDFPLFNYHGNRYWLSDANLAALSTRNREPQLSAPDSRPVQRFPRELLQMTAKHLPPSSLASAQCVCREFRDYLRAR